jgi:hypothetical protein
MEAMRLEQVFVRLSSWLDRTAFPRIPDADAEAHKVALLRIATGLVLVWRGAFMLRDSPYFFDPVQIGGGEWPLHAVAAAVQLLLACGLALGIAPAACAVLLLATHPAYSNWTGTYNLGPMLLAPTLGALAVLETGRFALWGRESATPPAALYRAVYLILFVAYAGWNFQALLFHVRDPYWTGGRTTGVLFTSSYLSEFYGVFRGWEASYPGVYALFSRTVGVLQTSFQLAMLPLMLTRWGGRFVLLWGWAFILGSLADLQLSILPVVEVIMWTLVFVPAGWFAFAGGAPARAATSASSRLRPFAVGLFCGAYGLLLLAFYVNAITVFTLGLAIGNWDRYPVLFYSGLVAPNVFNREDLSMGDRWPVIDRLDGPHRGLVPLNGLEGERLSYHRSDLLYFGNSLVWRRGMIDVADLGAYHRPGGNGYRLARQIVLYDWRRHGAVGPGDYRIRLFRNHASDFFRGSGPDRYQPELVLEFHLQAGPERR